MGAFRQHDAEIRRMSAAGKSNPEIAAALGIPLFRVKEARSRMNLTKRSESYEVEIRSDKPPKQYTCPVCRTLHWSAPGIWTCQPCKRKQEANGDTEILSYSIVEPQA